MRAEALTLVTQKYHFAIACVDQFDDNVPLVKFFTSLTMRYYRSLLQTKNSLQFLVKA